MPSIHTIYLEKAQAIVDDYNAYLSWKDNEEDIKFCHYLEVVIDKYSEPVFTRKDMDRINELYKFMFERD